MGCAEYDFDKVCRACLSEGNEMKSMFEVQVSTENTDGLALAGFYHSMTALKISKGDGLPEQLCERCVDMILSAYNFAQLCISTDATLRLQRNRTVLATIQKEIVEECNKITKNCSIKIEDEEDRTVDDVNYKEEPCLKDEENDLAKNDFSSELTESKPCSNVVRVRKNTELMESKPLNSAGKVRKKQFECTECKESFSREIRLKEHQKHHDPSRAYKCSECSKTFSKKSYLTIHEKSHIKSEDKQFICDECGQQFTYSYLLNQHSFKHKDVKPFPCTKCDKGCLTAESLRRHMKVHDKNYQKKKYACDICLKEYPYPSFLAEHMKNHTGERPFLCNICGKGFRQNGALEYHMRSHTGYKPFTCEICNQSFMSQSVLKVHMRRHTNERPYVCDICGMAFRQSTDMKGHKRVHTGDKPVVCNFCGKRMSTTGQLTIHIRSHTGERPFPCSTCSKAFATRTMLVKHERIHTGERPYMCNVCGRSFNQRSTLKTHELTHNSIKKPRVRKNSKIKPEQSIILRISDNGQIITNLQNNVQESVEVLVTKDNECITLLPAPIPLLQNL